MPSRELQKGGCTTRKIFISNDTKRKNASRATNNHQDLFYTIEKTPISESAKESFKRKPYSTGKEEK